jgi:hypothetical protein
MMVDVILGFFGDEGSMAVMWYSVLSAGDGNFVCCVVLALFCGMYFLALH